MTGLPALRILIVEDSPEDAELTVRELRRGGRDVLWERVDNAEAMRTALARPWDAIVCDYSIPGFGAVEALLMAQEHVPDVPFLIVSGTVGEETAVLMMRAGAHDYLLKDRLARLSAAVDREIAEAHARRDRREQDAALAALQEDLAAQTEIYESILHALDDAGEAVVVIEEGRVVYTNRSFERLTGLGRREVERGSGLFELIVPEERTAFTERFRSVGAAGARFDATIVARDGRRLPVTIVIARTGASGRRRTAVMARAR